MQINLQVFKASQTGKEKNWKNHMFLHKDLGWLYLNGIIEHDNPLPPTLIINKNKLEQYGITNKLFEIQRHKSNKQTVLTDFDKRLQNSDKTGKKPNGNDFPCMYECDLHEETMDYLLDLAKD